MSNMNLPPNHTFLFEHKDNSDKGCIISKGIMELPEGYDERAVVVEWGGETMIYLADGRESYERLRKHE